MNDVIETLKDGQIYRWRWADEARHLDGLRSWGSYHCRSQIAVVKNGRLLDTYWGDLTSERAVRAEDVVLEYLCDDNWPTIRPEETPMYDAGDIIDTRHPNSSRAPIYLRPGAVKSSAAILEEIAYREEKANGEIRSAQWKLERLAECRDRVAAGELDKVWF